MADSATAVAGPSAKGRFGALADRRFRLVVAGTLSAGLAQWGQMIGIFWLTFVLTDSTAQLGAISFATGTTSLVLTPLAGAVADRYERKRVIMSSAAIAICVATLTTMLIVSGAIEMWQVYVFGVLGAAANSLGQPARQAMVQDVAPREALGNAIATNSVALNIARVAGPPLLGVLAAWRVEAPFVVIGVMRAIDALVAIPLPRRTTPPTRRNPAQELRAGFSYVWSHPQLRDLVLGNAVLALIAYGYLAFLPVFSEDVLGAGARGYGLIAAMTGVGSVVGLAVVAGAGEGVYRPSLMIGCYYVHLAGVALFTQMESIWLALPVLALGGAGFGIAVATNTVLFQSRVAPEMRGRAMSIFQMGMLLLPISSLPMGWTIAAVGLQNGVLLHVLVAAAAFGVVAARIGREVR